MSTNTAEIVMKKLFGISMQIKIMYVKSIFKNDII